MKRSFLAFFPLGLWAAAVLSVGALEFGPTELPSGTDKAAHFAMYGIGGGLAAWAGRKQGSARAAWIALLLVILTGVADELHQGTTDTRHSDFMDWVADAAGAILVFLTVDLLLKKD